MSVTQLQQQTAEHGVTLQAFAVYDKKARTYSRPFFERSHINALRGFRAEVNRQESTNSLYTHPEDFELHVIGNFNDSTGALTPCQTAVISSAEALLNAKA